MTLATVRAAAEHIARQGYLLPHQLAAFAALDRSLTPEQREAFTADWRAAGSPAQPRPPKPSAHPNPLPVPFYQQLDSATDQGRRMCFSSSCAMLLAFLRPGILKGPNGDDQYLARVRTFGDTTSAIAQVQALNSYEVRADFTKAADFALIERQIDAGFPVPCGYLHRGPVEKPSGGGHWLTVVGYDATHVIVHDPLGEADLITGGTLNRPAQFCRYSRKNFGRRWMVEAPRTGWAIVVKR